MSTLYTPQDVAKTLQVPENTLKHWRSRREGPPFLHIGRLVRYDADELECWITAQRDAARSA